MKIIFLTSLLWIGLSLGALAQEIFIKTGINSTIYDFKSSAGLSLLKFTPGMGSTFEMGMGFPLLNKSISDRLNDFGGVYSPSWLKNEVSLGIDSYNSYAGDQNNNYSWETTYGGIHNTLSFLVHFGEVELGLSGQVGASKMISGTQVINTSRFSLNDHEDFSGIFLKAGGGASASYPVFQRGFLNLSYLYSKSTRMKGPADERLSFFTHSILFGLYVQLK
ncbi:MAG: hypothetical protein ACK5BR_05575 [Bacteroidota bacterium]|jgi:hypothetical protein